MSCGMVYFFRQKTAYEMRISDWSSDMCSSDLLFCSLFAGQCWLAVGNMAEQVESAEGVAIFDLVAQSIQRDAQRLQLFDDHLLLRRLAPAPEKFVQRFVVFLQRLFRVGTQRFRDQLSVRPEILNPL